MTQIQYPNDSNGSIQIAQGSDGRLNVSSRSDSRSYYNSRDKGLTFSVVWDDDDAAEGDYGVYVRNDSTDKELVVDSLGFNSTVSGAFKLHAVTGTAAGGVVITPLNMNRSSTKDAAATCRGEGAVSGLTSLGVIDIASVTAGNHEEMRLKDRLRLGQGDAIALEFDRGLSNTIAEGVIFFYYE